MLALAAGLAFGLAGCASIEKQEVEQKESMLSAAGFSMKPATTPAQRANLATLPPNKLVAQPVDGQVRYFYADPKTCGCVYVGDEKAYQTYQRLVFEQRIADEQRMSAEMNEDAAMDWGAWGPGPWGPY